MVRLVLIYIVTKYFIKIIIIITRRKLNDCVKVNHIPKNRTRLLYWQGVGDLETDADHETYKGSIISSNRKNINGSPMGGTQKIFG